MSKSRPRSLYEVETPDGAVRVLARHAKGARSLAGASVSAKVRLLETNPATGAPADPV